MARRSLHCGEPEGPVTTAAETALPGRLGATIAAHTSQPTSEEQRTGESLPSLGTSRRRGGATSWRSRQRTSPSLCRHGGASPHGIESHRPRCAPSPLSEHLATPRDAHRIPLRRRPSRNPLQRMKPPSGQLTAPLARGCSRADAEVRGPLTRRRGHLCLTRGRSTPHRCGLLRPRRRRSSRCGNRRRQGCARPPRGTLWR